MRKPVPYKKPETIKKRSINKKNIILFALSEIVAIILAIVTTATVSLLFNISPTISTVISALVLITLSIFIANKFLSK